MTWEHVLLPQGLEEECVGTAKTNGADYNSKDENDDEDQRCKIVGLEPQDPSEVLMDKIVLGGSAFAILGLVVLMIRGTGDWRYYLSGGICAAFSHLIPVPVDVIKTRKQVDASLADANFMQATRQIIHNEGWRSLFVGTAPTFWGYFLEGAIKFGVYEFLKPWIKVLIPMKFVAFILSAAISGVAASIMLSPMEALRIRLVAEPEYARLGWIQGGLRMIELEGASGFRKGLLPMMYKQVPYTITKNVSFDLLTKLAYGALLLEASTASSTTKFAIPLASAALASILSCVSSQPGDMLLSLVNAHGGSRRTHEIARDILRSDRGIRGFFVGMKTRLLHVGIIVTLQLLIYDFTKRMCGIAATGSV
ncbi:hypothetical protein ACA910_001078 [Epithemia clementina (nom. ined.)]